MANGNSYPVNIDQTLLWKTRNFPDTVYNFDPLDNLTTLMSVLLGGTGTGQLTSVQVAARLTQQYLSYSDLENTIGELLNAPRIPNEIYNSNINPFTDQLIISQWQDVYIKDSNYRERLISMIASLLRGGNPLGVQSMAESIYQLPVQIVENWTSASGAMNTNNWSRGLGPNEIIAIPVGPSDIPVASGVRNAALKALEQIAPVGAIITQVSGVINNFASVPYTSISGNSEFFYLNQTVTANNVNIPSYVLGSTDPSITSRYWLTNNKSQQAPYFAYLQSQESAIDLTNNISIVNVTPYANGQALVTSGTTTPLGSHNLSITSTFFGSV